MLDLTSFGYICAARILQLDKRLSPSSVVTISQSTPTMATDSAIVSLVSKRLGMRSGLIANDVGSDRDGDYLVQLINRDGIQTEIRARDNLVTPQMFDICDSNGARTLLTFMPGVVEQLLAADLKLLDSSRLAYVDLYTEIGKASVRAIDYAMRKEVSLFVNLAHDHLHQKMTMLQTRERITILQASLDASSQEDPDLLASAMLQKTCAEVALVTLGPRGALGATRSEVIRIPAYRVKSIKTTFGAGAAFSAGFAFAYLNDWNLEKCLKFACGLATMNCTVPNGLSTFSSEEVLDFIDG